MKNVVLTASLCGAAFCSSASPAFAFEVPIEQALCPFEAIGDNEIDIWGGALIESQGQMTEAQLEVLGKSVKDCAEKLNWTEADTVSALEFNIAIIGSTAIGDKLEADGIDAVAYETVLENRTAEELQQILDDPENSPALDELTEKMIAEFGDKLTDEITGDLATYIAFMAQAQFSAVKMLGDAH